MIMKPRKEKARAFKYKKFSKDASKASITDAELYRAIQEVMQGQAVDLGGGVYKKRLNKNTHRSIILAKGKNIWVFQYLYAKKDLDNISIEDLVLLKTLASNYGAMTVAELDKLIESKELQEIYYGDEEI